MIAQLGSPTFFLTLTAHESQPQLLAACAYAHLRSMPEYREKSLRALANVVDEAVDTLMNKRGRWLEMTALDLCRQYPATVAREFMRMVRELLRWLAPSVECEGGESEA